MPKLCQRQSDAGRPGYDADCVRAALIAKKIVAGIVSKADREKPILHDEALYHRRDQIENMFERVKD